ncbi:MAG TPA: alkaline phosphatase family protein, partial [Steroidobacteraceae bacterium]|nr:alkaline phosphatase family protein [Steroidobacteraceae bacterium]
MRFAARVLFAFCLSATVLAQAQTPRPFKHVVVIFQENRTPDNLFRELLNWPGIDPARYDIATWGENSKGQIVPIDPVALGIPYDLSHAHAAFVAMYDHGKMDGADKIPCIGKCIPNPQFKYVSNAGHILDPYLTLAADYGWANAMFQTNQGPSYPAHQFIFGGTSAPSARDDRSGIFIAENPAAPKSADYLAGSDTGCLAPLNEWNWLIGVAPDGTETRLVNNPLGQFCYSRQTMATLLDQRNLSWKYYAPAQVNPAGANPGGSIWTAPASIRQICQPNEDYTECLGRGWASNVDLVPADVLRDIADCRLSNVSWVIPDGRNSDHPGSTTTTGGPSWVAAIVNAIGTASGCEGGAGYWSDTAILITWDDWGGWYDHVLPTVLAGLQGHYQYGFRVPLIVVSAYTPRGYVNDTPHDFGSILRFIEGTFDIPQGALGFADERAVTDLFGFFDFQRPPRPYKVVPAPLDAAYFINDTRPPEPP